MKKARAAYLIAMLAIVANSYSVTVKTPANLNVYYPEYSKIDPDTEGRIFCYILKCGWLRPSALF